MELTEWFKNHTLQEFAVDSGSRADGCKTAADINTLETVRRLVEANETLQERRI